MSTALAPEWDLALGTGPGRQRRAGPDSLPESGALVDERYRLLRRLDPPLAGGAPPQRWAGVDELLDRPIEVRLLPQQTVEDLVRRLTGDRDGRWLRLLDAGVTGTSGWAVIEDPCRPSLAQRLSSGPLDEIAALELGVAAAAAVAAAPSGVDVTAALRPDRIYLDGDDLRIDGVAALLDEAAPAPGDTVVAVGRTVFAALTGHWPNPAAGVGLPPTDERSPRRHNGDISRPTDRLVTAALRGEPPALPALVQVMRDELQRVRASRVAPPAGLVGRRIATRVLPPLAIALLGLLAWTVGSNLGAIPAPDRITPVHSHSPTPPAAKPVWRNHPPAITSFDPQGDGIEDPAGAAAAVDDRPDTAWLTDRYTTAGFGGLKSGVGLLVDLGSPRVVGSAVLHLTAAGGAVQMRAGNIRPAVATDLPVVATARPHGTVVRLPLRPAVRARYWLIWFTALPPDAGGYRDGVATLRLFTPAKARRP